MRDSTNRCRRTRLITWLLVLMPLVSSANADEKPGPDDAEQFLAGKHYQVLESPVPLADASRIEVVSAFSYGCLQCLHMEDSIRRWEKSQASDVDLKRFHPIWNPDMELYARAYLAALHLGVVGQIHVPLTEALVVKHQPIEDEAALRDFFIEHGVSSKAFQSTFESPELQKGIEQIQALTRAYHLGSVPEFVVNGRYRVDPMRAGGRERMLEVVSFLVEKERERLSATR